jgi:hypothetical protein
MNSIRIPINVSPANIWSTIRKHSYSAMALQALCELIDNSITAVSLMGKPDGRILLKINFEKRTASIEDNGCGFPSDIDKLANAWSYGVPNPHGLSEHGCGAKSALSIFDKNNNDWKCYWKNGDGKIYMVQAPLDYNFERHEVDSWPGDIKESTGTFMEFPFSDDVRLSLYSKNAKGVRNEEGRIISHLNQTYMMEPNLKNGSIILTVNNNKIIPFTLSKGEDTIRYDGPLKFEMSTGCNVELTMIEMKHEVKGSWFNRNQISGGLRIWKQGRHIQHINSGEAYKRWMGIASHPDYNGIIILVSIFGEQVQMPSTDPTKTVMCETDKSYDELCNLLQSDIYKFMRNGKNDSIHERDLVSEFTNMRQYNMSEISGYNIEINKAFESKTPPIDIVETFSQHILMYEAKKDNRVQWQAIAQLYANYKLVKNITDKTIKKAILLINSKRGDPIMHPALLDWINTLKNDGEFPLYISNYENETLWPIDEPISYVKINGKSKRK